MKSVGINNRYKTKETGKHLWSYTVVDSSLTLEKINARRISDLDERMEKRLGHIETKIDRIADVILSKKGNGVAPAMDMRAIAVIFTVMGLMLGLLGQNIMFINEKAEKQLENFDRLFNATAINLTHRLDAMESSLQQEMKLMNDITIERIKSLDEKLQIEMRAVNPSSPMD